MFALWLNSFFSAFDFVILEALHEFAVATEGSLTFLFIGISFLVEKGVVFILGGLILIAFKQTRKMGVCVILAIALGALVTNLILKDLIARPRPYVALEVYSGWWSFAQSQVESDMSFPSGHTTATMAFVTAVFLMSKNKKVSWLIFLAPLVMGVARNYLMVHYPSDILGGILVGAAAGIVAYFITQAIFKHWEQWSRAKQHLRE